MTATEMANELFHEIEAKNTDAAEKLLTDDFTFSGPVPQPIGGAEWMAMHRSLSAAFPDWKFNVSDLHEHGDMIHGAVQITGTHKGELDLSSLGMPNVPATGKSIKLPREAFTLTITNGKFSSFNNPPTDGGGVMGILSQLGVKVPSAH